VTTYTDSYGRQWELIDFHVNARGDGKRRVELGSREAHGRASKHGDERRVYWFGLDDRGTSEHTVKAQFRNARLVPKAAGWQL
jgi:hypothetical protein